MNCVLRVGLIKIDGFSFMNRLFGINNLIFEVLKGGCSKSHPLYLSRGNFFNLEIRSDNL